MLVGGTIPINTGPTGTHLIIQKFVFCFFEREEKIDRKSWNSYECSLQRTLGEQLARGQLRLLSHFYTF